MATELEPFELAVAHHRGGRPREAEQICRRILLSNPGHAQALRLLGAIALHGGQPERAQEHLAAALGRAPDSAEVQNELGNLLQDAGQLDEAIACFERARQLLPGAPQIHYNLGNALRAAGQGQAAEMSYREALRLAPDFAPAHNNLGTLRQSLGDLAEAEHCYRQAVHFEPRYAEAYYNLGVVLEKRGDMEAAQASYQHAISLNPDHAHAHYNLATILQSREQKAEAIAGYETALRLRPDYVEAYNNLAVLLTDMDEPDAAIEYCRKGLAIEPTSAALVANMATALQNLGLPDEAVAAARKSVELRPEGVGEHTNLLYKLNFNPACDPPAIYREHLEWAKRHAEPLTALAEKHSNDRTPERRLRIGYVSPYFRDHAVNFFTEPMIVAHDSRQFEIFCYSDVAMADAATGRLRATVNHWRDVRQQSDAQLAHTIRADAIDILVDLTGHISGNRLLTFARKPAPIQVTYIGYQNTTGMSAMDYRLTDSWADPPGTSEAFYTEKLVRLPGAFFCYRPSDDCPSVAPLPALESGHITFGSFNNFAKVAGPVIETWLDLLKRVERSRLLVLARGGGSVQKRFENLAQERHMDPKRIEFCDKRPRRAYLDLFARVDIALDPFPFNGHTTTCDSIWMGVPVVMLAGHSYASRFGGSVLVNVGLEKLIADTRAAYVDRAAELAADLEGLKTLRGGLRGRMAESVLLDAAGFTRNLEAAYRRMWIDWCGAAAV
jgi:predicted O-linked N-acetylglucosamine transferase (SPINDLY family)